MKKILFLRTKWQTNEVINFDTTEAACSQMCNDFNNGSSCAQGVVDLNNNELFLIVPEIAESESFLENLKSQDINLEDLKIIEINS